MTAMLTVAICTWNRREMLRLALDALVAAEHPRVVPWELLIVENNCTDDTVAVATSFADRLPLRVVHQPTPGLSHARNAAIDAARGSHVLWTDDDVRVDRAWLTTYEQALLQYPDFAFFGGTVEPWFEGEPPGWLRAAWRSVGDAFALREQPGLREITVPRHLPYGANYAVRLDHQRRHRYDARLGRRPDAWWVVGEETQVLTAILEDGGRGYWLEAARVRHWIPRERQTLDYVRRYYEGVGRTRATFETASGALALAGVPSWLVRILLETHVAYGMARVTGDPRQWLPRLAEAAMSRGEAGARLRAKASR